MTDPARRPPSATSRLRASLAAAQAVWVKVALMLVLLAAIWGAIGLSLHDDWRQLRTDSLRHAADLAALAEQGIARTVEAIDQRLLFARDAYRRDPAHFSLSFIDARSGYSDGMMMQLSLIGKDGVLVDSNLGPTGRVDLSDRPHFRIHLTRGDDFLFISRPVLGRVSQRWSVQFTRKVPAPDGRFGGVVVGSLDPVWMTGLFRSLGVTGGIELVGEDGVVRAAAPDLAWIGRDISDTPPWREMGARPGGSFLLRGRPAPLAVGFRHLAHYPLVVAVRLDMARQVALHRQRVREDCAMGLLLSLVVVLAGLRLIADRRSLVASRRELRHAIENIDEGLVMLDPRGRIQVSNRRFGELLRLPGAAARAGGEYREITARQSEGGLVDRRGLPAAAIPRPAEGAPGPPVCVDERCLPDGVVLEVRARVLENGGTVCTFADITARQRAQERIQHLAHHDVLTGLANRALLREHLQAAIERARRTRGRFALLCLDLDRFKPVNDSLGHGAGDALLCEVGERVTTLAGATAVVARFGGDEFVVLAPLAGQPAEAAALAERLARGIARPFRFQSHELCVGTSIGIALYPQDGATAEALLHHADTALYRAKEAGRGTACFFEASMEERLQRRAELEHDIRAALAQGQFRLHFQPLFDCRDRTVRSFEALLRWQHPRRGAVSPAEFIPVAEECGLIVPIGRWVLEEACRVAAGWEGGQSVAVNLSPMQFRQAGLVELVTRTLAHSGLPAGRLELEVTEGILVEDAAGALATMQALKALGVSFALDDFGTGYSSLSYLQRFPFDRIKIDKAFVQAVETQESARVIIKAILAIGRSLRLGITAEGVETPAQLGFLHQHGCDTVQGFLLGRPVPAQAVESGGWDAAA